MYILSLFVCIGYDLQQQKKPPLNLESISPHGTKAAEITMSNEIMAGMRTYKQPAAQTQAM
jgi:hypothetical protein